MSSSAIRELQIEQIRKDLGAFSDPGTVIDVSKMSGRSVSISWTLRRQNRTDTFSLSATEGIHHVAEGERMSYRSFLASEALSDLYGLAQMIKQTSSRDIYVPTKAVVEGRNEASPEDAICALGDSIGAAADAVGSEDHTLVLMVKGQAGAGKTEALKELVKRQAEAYLKGNARFVYLYVDAQGRALTRLNEAFAIELQDLRARLTYHQIATLVRADLIVPVIDGFDELIGVSGYEDAFGSLSAFLAELQGRGSLIASARSLFYEREFVSRASKANEDAWELRAISVLPWSAAERNQYVEEVGALEELEEAEVSNLKKRLDQAFSGGNSSLGEKPFFVAKTLSLILDGYLASDCVDLREALISGFLTREADTKLCDADGKAILSAQQTRSLMQEISEEMWNFGVRELDANSLKEVTEYLAQLFELQDEAARILLERITTMAFFRKGSTGNKFAFEHEMFLEFFLAEIAIKKLDQTTDQIKVFCSRGLMEKDIFQEIERQLTFQEDGRKILSYLDNVTSIEISSRNPSTVLPENLGHLFASLARSANRQSCDVSGLSLSSLIFKGTSFNGVLIASTKFKDCQFFDADFVGLELKACVFSNSFLFSTRVKEGRTLLDVDGLSPTNNVQGIVVLEDGAEKEYFKAPDILRVLASLGVKGLDLEEHRDEVSVPVDVEDLIDRLVAAYRKANPICKGDDYLQQIFGHPKWSEVETLLKKHGLVTEEYRNTSGRKVAFLRRQFLPDQLLAAISSASGVPRELKRFWKDLASLK